MNIKEEISIISQASTKVSIENGIQRERLGAISSRSKALLLRRSRKICRSMTTSKMSGSARTRFIHIFYGPLALAILTLGCFSTTLLPVHNVITNPEYWYEIIFSSTSVFFHMACCSTIAAECTVNPFNKTKFRIIPDLFLTMKLVESLGYGMIHMIWSIGLGYFEPFPKKYHIVFFLCFLALITRLWNLIPRQKRMDPASRKKCVAFIGYYVWLMFQGFQVVLILDLLGLISQNHLWLIALIMLLTKEINGYVADKLITKSALAENLLEAQFMAKINNNLCYSLVLTLVLTKELEKTVRKVTELALLGINFAMNLVLCHKAIRQKSKVLTFDSNARIRKSLMEEAVTELILNEVAEIIVPIAFILSYVVAFYGPNKDVLAGVGCTIWKSHEIEDLWSFLIPVVKMAALDSGSFLLAGGLLWECANINIVQEYCKTIKKYWKHLAFHGASYWSAVSIKSIRKISNLLTKS